MEKFTKTDYLMCSKLFMMQMQVCEESAQYKLPVEGKVRIHQDKDKLFKAILSDKREVIKFIEKYLENKEFGKLSEKDIEKYDKELLIPGFKRIEADIIYKIVNKDFYIIIEHQSKIDKTMPRRMAKYCVGLVDTLNRNTKEEIYPTIYPIVLYTGEKKWNVEDTIKEKDPYQYGTKPLNYPRYNLVDINNYTKEEFIQENTAMSKALLFEKVKPGEMVDVLKLISKKDLCRAEINCIKMIFLYSNKIRNLLSSDNEYYEIIMKGRVEDMRFEEKFFKAINLEVKKTIKQMVKAMIEKNISDSDIMEITQINPKELEKLKMA